MSTLAYSIGISLAVFLGLAGACNPAEDRASRRGSAIDTVFPPRIAAARALTPDGKARAAYVADISAGARSTGETTLVLGTKGSEAHIFVLKWPDADPLLIANLAGNAGKAGAITSVPELQRRGFSEMILTNGSRTWSWNLAVLLRDGRDWTSIGDRERVKTSAYKRILFAQRIASILSGYGNASVVIARDSEATLLSISNWLVDSLDASRMANGSFEVGQSGDPQGWRAGAFEVNDLARLGFREILISNGQQAWTYPAVSNRATKRMYDR